MTDKKTRITAAELMAELDADPAFTARKKLKDEELRQAEAEWRIAEAPLVRELRQVGEKVDSVWDLVNTARPYPTAIPVLLKHLQQQYPDRVREGIARALAVPDARIGWSTLVELFIRDQDKTALGAKAAIGLALAAATDDEVLEDVITLLRDKRHGANRIALLRALKNSSNPRSTSVLLELRDDPELSFEIRKALRCRNEPRHD